MTRRAEIHKGSTLTPSKAELLGAWIPQQPWFTVGSDDITIVGSFRFVDPAGEVGIETHLVRADEHVFHVPVTYRGAPLADAGDALVGTIEHGALGMRYVYDGMVDPVYLAELERVIRDADTAVETVSTVDGTITPPTMDVAGTGVADDVVAEELEVVGLITDETYDDAAGRLVAVLTEDGTTRNIVLAALR